MAKAMGRRDNKRAATAYELDPASARKIDYDDMRRATTSAERVKSCRSRGYDRAQAHREAMRTQSEAEGAKSSQQRATAEQQRSAQPAAEPQPMSAKEIHEARLKAFQESDREKRKAALQALQREFGADLTEQKGEEIRSRGPGRRAFSLALLMTGHRQHGRNRTAPRRRTRGELETERPDLSRMPAQRRGHGREGRAVALRRYRGRACPPAARAATTWRRR